MLHLCEVRPHKNHVILREVTVQAKQKMLKTGNWGLERGLTVKSTCTPSEDEELLFSTHGGQSQKSQCPLMASPGTRHTQIYMQEKHPCWNEKKGKLWLGISSLSPRYSPSISFLFSVTDTTFVPGSSIFCFLAKDPDFHPTASYGIYRSEHIIPLLQNKILADCGDKGL